MTNFTQHIADIVTATADLQQQVTEALVEGLTLEGEIKEKDKYILQLEAALVACQSGSGGSDPSDDGFPFSEQFLIPPREAPIDPATADIIIKGEEVFDVSDPVAVSGTYIDCTGTSLNPVVEALKLANTIHNKILKGVDEVIIRVDGPVPHKGVDLQIGGGDSGIKNYRVEWSDVSGNPIPITGVKFVGINDASVNEFHIHDNLKGIRHGVDDLHFENIDFICKGDRAIGSPAGHSNGRLTIYNATIRSDPDDPTAYQGFGGKWGVRCSGGLSYDFRDVHFESFEEHCFYANIINGGTHAGPSYFQNITMDGTQRTMFQLVDRQTENPGQNAGGLVVFDNCNAFNIYGAGGSNFTTAGHLGDIIYLNCGSFEGPANETAGQSYRSILAWETPDKGTTYNENGFHTCRIAVIGHDISMPNSRSTHMQFTGVEELQFHSFLIQGAKAAIELDADVDTGLVANGTVKFFVHADYDGFQTPIKVMDNFGVWSDEDIEAHYEGTDSAPL